MINSNNHVNCCELSVFLHFDVFYDCSKRFEGKSTLKTNLKAQLIMCSKQSLEVYSFSGFEIRLRLQLLKNSFILKKFEVLVLSIKTAESLFQSSIKHNSAWLSSRSCQKFDSQNIGKLHQFVVFSLEQSQKKLKSFDFLHFLSFSFDLKPKNMFSKRRFAN